MLLRIAFVVLAVAGGSGLVAYVVAWLLVPTQPGGRTLATAALQDRTELARAAGVGVIVLGSLALLRLLGLWFAGGLAWPAALASAGLFLVWRTAGEEDRTVLSRVAAQLPVGIGRPLEFRSRRTLVLRLVVGVTLILGGVTAFLAVNRAVTAVRDGLIATFGIVAGVAIIFGPWWWRLAQDLAEERRQRIRSQERAEMAAHVHDSVLQTLALIQRQADDPRSVVGLARRQERELRTWLYGGPPVPDDVSFRAAMTRASEEVEEVHGVAVDVVIVGDGAMDERLQAMVGAAKEAMVNAAKWSQTRAVSLYAEVESESASAFVRDRGVGFDPDLVAPNHRGIAESIRGRMERQGGSVAIRTAADQGTEVELIMPRAIE